MLGLAAFAAAALFAPAGAAAAPKPAVLTLKTVRVGAPGNPSAAIVPFTDAIYRSCSEAPSSGAACQEVGGVKHRFGIGQLEVTVAQWVAFLNTVDPRGQNRHGLYSSKRERGGLAALRPDRLRRGGPGRSPLHGRLARMGRQALRLRQLPARRPLRQLPLQRPRPLPARERRGGFHYVTYRARLSRRTERGMYDLANPKTTRLHGSGFVLPSQDEWIKAAYYDPSGGGTYSYWKYPTNPGVFGDGSATAPAASTLDPADGDVTNAATQPLATYHASGQPAPSWCPSTESAEACANGNPFGLDPALYAGGLPGQPLHGRPGGDALALGHPRPGR